MRTASVSFAAALIFSFLTVAEAQDFYRQEAHITLVGLMDNMLYPPKDKEKCTKLARRSIDTIKDYRFEGVVQAQQTTMMIREGCFDAYSHFIAPSVSIDPSFSSSVTPVFETYSAPPVLEVGKSIYEDAEARGALYVQVPSFFAHPATHLVKKMSEYVRKEGKEPRFLILDLRNNYGGDILRLQQFLELFSPGTQDLAYSLVPRVGSVTEVRFGSRGSFAHIPAAVLVNKVTWSAAETAAGVLKQFGKVIVGEKTRGKGVTQRRHNLGFIEVALTKSEVLLGPQKIPYHGHGIDPDVGMRVVDATPTYTASDPTYRKAIEGLYLP